jgi:hypothetical protein
MANARGPSPSEDEGIEGDDDADASSDALSSYPIDDVLVRHNLRTVTDIMRRIKQGGYIMDPDFQRAFVWDEERQSRLIESALMRIPLPVFYLAERSDGKVVVVDGLQRLTTFRRFLEGTFALKLKNPELNGKKFSELPPSLQNRIEDTNLTLYLLDAKMPEKAKLDIFERVNSGVPINHQQMRNCLYTGPATRWLKRQSESAAFRAATGESLDAKAMRDREVINRFCAFSLLGVEAYKGDMDDFLSRTLAEVNTRPPDFLDQLELKFQRSMKNNLQIFGRQAFRKHTDPDARRGRFNIALFDVLSTFMADVEESAAQAATPRLRQAFYALMDDKEFVTGITYSTNSTKSVRLRFDRLPQRFLEAL